MTPDGPGWIDVTRALGPGHPVWPGDTRFELTETARIPDGSSVNLLRLTGTTHLGTHVDAPWHYDDEGERLDAVPLEVLMGPAVLIDVSASGGPIDAAELPGGPLPPRVLVRTGEPDAWTAFPEDFRPFSPGAIQRLSEAGVRLLGTDAPSVDALTSKDLAAHHACGRSGVTIVEGLALSRAPVGPCELICLPLSLVGADAAPARAVLRGISP